MEREFGLILVAEFVGESLIYAMQLERLALDQ